MKARTKKSALVLGIIVIPALLGAFYLFSENPSGIITQDTEFTNDDSSDEKDFVFAFYSEIAKDSPESNLFLSPFSISTAFSMAYEGAAGNTASEMQQVFGFISDDQKRRESISDTLARLDSKNDLYKLQIANALWIKDGYQIKQDYLDTATTYYDSTVDNVDFVTNDGVNKINRWTSEKTQGKIKDVLAPDSTDELTRMVITNAIYFKGKWGNQFNPGNTSDKLFWLDKDKSVTVPMMKSPADMFNYYETKDLQAIKMYYVGGDISMIVLLPKDKNGLGSLEDSLNMQKLDFIRDMMTMQPLTIQMPKFEFETEYKLVDSLENLGIHDAFDENNADFQGMTDEQVYLDQAIHKAFVNVNEEGTEAAAITALVVRAQSGPPEPRHEFVADHPFVFIIQENNTGEILFIGRLANPLI
ncbi:MAG: serpin family protein [Thaumarchaeota archaeon]|nr:serpin family protein [Nitrososphaerota archaeon]